MENCKGSILTNTGCGKCPECIEEKKVLAERQQDIKEETTDIEIKDFDPASFFDAPCGSIKEWEPTEVFDTLGVPDDKRYQFDIDELLFSEASLFDGEAKRIKAKYTIAGYSLYKQALSEIGIDITNYEADYDRVVVGSKDDEEKLKSILNTVNTASSNYNAVEMRAKAEKIDFAYKKVSGFYANGKKVELSFEAWKMIPFKIRESVYDKLISISSVDIGVFANL